jgi:hypothetical protein
MTNNERVRRSISATLTEIEQAPWQWQQLSDVIEALQIIQRIEHRLNLPSQHFAEGQPKPAHELNDVNPTSNAQNPE